MPTRPEVINMRTTTETFYRYIGRSEKPGYGLYGNPVVIGLPCPECGAKHRTNADTLPCYKKYLWNRIENEPWFREKVRTCIGKKLACFCKPAPCHGDILADAVVWLCSEEGLAKYPLSEN